jgi:hypothetical protein
VVDDMAEADAGGRIEQVSYFAEFDPHAGNFEPDRRTGR